MNTRLQVEHAVTEETTGIDLVSTQIRLAAEERLDQVVPQASHYGHAIQARIYAEDPVRLLPSPGALKVFRPPVDEGVRVETGYREGNMVTPHYDPMIAIVVARGTDREQAIDRLRDALAQFAIAGIKSNIPFLLSILASPEFRGGHVHTGLTAALRQAANG
jgi:acetyl-CoA carboxylase biotin carboxylase subunit